MKNLRVAWLIALSAVPLGCGDDVGGGATMKGELGDGYFQYVCAGNSDPLCPDGVTASSFPQAIAVGGRFSLRYEPRRGGALPVVEPGSRTALSKSADVFTLHEPGYVAVFAQDAFGDVIDLLHLRGRRVAVMTITRNGMEQSSLRLEVGDRIDLEAQPRDEFQTLLAGSLHYDWSSSDPRVFVLASDVTDDDVTIEAVAPGDALLHIEAGGHVLTVPVEVRGEVDPGTTGDTESDTDFDDESTGTTGDSSTDDDDSSGGSTDDSTTGGD